MVPKSMTSPSFPHTGVFCVCGLLHFDHFPGFLTPRAFTVLIILTVRTSYARVIPFFARGVLVRRVHFLILPRFSTLMERAEVMTALRNGGEGQFPKTFEQRVPENAKKVTGCIPTGLNIIRDSHRALVVKIKVTQLESVRVRVRF